MNEVEKMVAVVGAKLVPASWDVVNVNGLVIASIEPLAGGYYNVIAFKVTGRGKRGKYWDAMFDTLEEAVAEILNDQPKGVAA